jgi:hypothetical protein
MVQGDYTDLLQSEALKRLQLQIAKQKELISHNEAWLMQSVWIRPEYYHNKERYAVHAQELATFDLDSDGFFRVCANQPREDMAGMQEEPIVSKVPETYSHSDLYIIIFHNFLSNVTIYGLIMTNWQFLIAIGVNPLLAGLVQAVTPASAFVFGFFMNYMTKWRQFYFPFLFEQLIMAIGLALYFVAGYWVHDSTGKALGVMIAGRVLMGFGEGSVITRKWISVGVQPWALEKWAGMLGILGGVGLCLGPGLNAALTFYQGGSSLGVIPLYEYTIFAFTMMLVWGIMFIFTAIFFVGTNKMDIEEKISKNRINSQMIQFFRKVKNQQLRVLLDLHTIEEDRNDANQWSEAVHEAIDSAALQRKLTIPDQKDSDKLDGQDLMGHVKKAEDQPEIVIGEDGNPRLRRQDSGVVVVNTADKQTGPGDEADPNSHIVLTSKGKIKDPQSENISPVIDVRYPTRWAVFCMCVIVMNKVD